MELKSVNSKLARVCLSIFDFAKAQASLSPRTNSDSLPGQLDKVRAITSLVVLLIPNTTAKHAIQKISSVGTA